MLIWICDTYWRRRANRILGEERKEYELKISLQRKRVYSVIKTDLTRSRILLVRVYSIEILIRHLNRETKKMN